MEKKEGHDWDDAKKGWCEDEKREGGGYEQPKGPGGFQESGICPQGPGSREKNIGTFVHYLGVGCFFPGTEFPGVSRPIQGLSTESGP